MDGKFFYSKFSDIDISDDFFKSLKNDYPGTENSTGFEMWFDKKIHEGEEALIYKENNSLAAFLYIKKESEPIILENNIILQKKDRIKIGTLKISEDYRGQRIGEGAIGIALWEWQRSKYEEIYVTVFSKHTSLIKLLNKFGFIYSGNNLNGESIYIKNRNNIIYDNSYTSFPFVNPNIKKAGYIIFEDCFHDNIFLYSELNDGISNSRKSNLAVANGICKIYVSHTSEIKYDVGEPVLIYRKYNGEGAKRYKSCVTSFCIISNAIQVKKCGRKLLSVEELLQIIGNKSIFDESEIIRQYNAKNSMIVYEMLYYAYFGAGNNINLDWLQNHNLWTRHNEYPTDIQLNKDEFIKILQKGNLDVQNIIID